MKTVRALPVLGLIALAGCIPPASDPPPAPRAEPVATPAPEPLPPPVTAPPIADLPDAWMDQPQTPGDWTYRAIPEGSGAMFANPAGQPLFSVTCTRALRRVMLARVAPSLPASGTMEIRTETAARDATLTTMPDGTGLGWSLDAADGLLDAIAFSRGRFAVGVSGADPLYLPSYPEITGVVEDCRG